MDPIITTEFIKAWGAYGAFLLVILAATIVLWRALRKCDAETRTALLESTKFIADHSISTRLQTAVMESRDKSTDELVRLVMAQSSRLEALEVAAKNDRETSRQEFEQLQRDVGTAVGKAPRR